MSKGPPNLSDGGREFRDRVKNPNLFRAYMLAKAPVLGVTGAYLDRIDLEQTEMVVPFGRGTKNLFGNMFGGALAAAAEMNSASMLVLHARNAGVSVNAELVRLTFEEHVSSRETLRAICRDGDRYAALVADAAANGEATDTFGVVFLDNTGVKTHDVEITWRITRK